MELLKKQVRQTREGLGGRRWVKQSELLAERESATEAATKRRRVEREPEEEEKPLTTEEPAATSNEEFKLTGAYATEKREEDESDDDESDYGLIRAWIRATLGEWRAKLEARPEAHKKTAHGRVDTQTFRQCEEYIRPLVKLCKARTLDAAMTSSLAKIIKLASDGEFVKAHDAYILIAIGNAAWPIGVTSIGIHTRTAREAVEQKNIAHVMNNEMQRKYLTSVKRLLRFMQDNRPDIPPSKKVL